MFFLIEGYLGIFLSFFNFGYFLEKIWSIRENLRAKFSSISFGFLIFPTEEHFLLGIHLANKGIIIQMSVFEYFHKFNPFFRKVFSNFSDSRDK